MKYLGALAATLVIVFLTAMVLACNAETVPLPERVATGDKEAGSSTIGADGATPMAPAQADAGSASDRAALVALYQATGESEFWKNNSDWLSEAPLERWAGVTTGSGGRVTRLDLRGNELTGQIPPELGGLSNLEFLDLSNNLLTGQIPPELGRLSALRVMGLKNNLLTGSIPRELGNLSALEALTLSGNSLTGEIPPEMGKLHRLNHVELSGVYYLDDGPVLNQFTGCLSEDLFRILSTERVYGGTDPLTLGLWVCTGEDIVVNGKGDPAVYNDNVFVLPVGDVLGQLRPLELANRFYEHFEDAFDFLILIPNKYPFEQHGQVNPFYRRISNDVEGIGEQVFSDSRSAGSEGRLQGIIYVHNTVAVLGRGILLHELMHRWAASITGSVGGHWSFSSANGLVGGFDIEDLVDLGNGRFSIRAGYIGGGSFGRPERYSPIELYLAGLIPAQEVPDLWVAEDVEWVLDESGQQELTDGRFMIFKAGTVRTYTIQEIIAVHGERGPDASRSQKDFGAAAIMLIDEDHPAIRWQLDKLSNEVAKFGFAGTNENEMINFYEATGGRGTFSLDDLTQFQRPSP